MNALLEHVWGKCGPADWVWSQVSTMRPAEAVLQLLMALEAFVDESEGSGLLVLGGAIAPTEAWVAFSKEWEKLLPFAPLGDDMKRNFHLTEMIDAGPSRVEKIPAFSKVIDDHVPMTLSVELYFADIEAAKQRLEFVVGRPILWGDAAKPYALAVTHLVSWCADHGDDIKNSLGSDGPIEFFFDDRTERKLLRDSWDEIVENMPPEERSKFGAELRFVDDKKFLGLQAADYLAGWSRYWIEKGEEPEVDDIYFNGNRFDGLKVTGKLKPHIFIRPTVDSIAEFLARGLEEINIQDKE
jgi:hypothetical protein